MTERKWKKRSVEEGDIRDFKNQRRRRQRERLKNNSFYMHNNNLAHASRFLYISLPVSARLQREKA